MKDDGQVLGKKHEVAIRCEYRKVAARSDCTNQKIRVGSLNAL
jgi:hypothetical protein